MRLPLLALLLLTGCTSTRYAVLDERDTPSTDSRVVCRDGRGLDITSDGPRVRISLTVHDGQVSRAAAS